MMWISILLIAASITGLVASARSRTAQLARIAKSNGCAFDKRKDSVTTQLTAGRLEFFTLFFHQYHNVFTCSDHLSFIRVADDIIYVDENPKTKPIPLTIFTAELKNKQFPLLKIAPLRSAFAPSQHALMKTNIPAIDSRYRIHTPSPAAGLLFSPMITGLLKTRPQIYLELNENALIYHEHALIAVEDMEAFRFRAMQILGELETLLDKMERNNGDTAPATQDNTQLRADALLHSFEAAPAAAPLAKGFSFRGIWLFVLLLIFLGISFLSWFALRNWVGN